MTAIHAEITADHREFILVAGGDSAPDLALAAKLLQLLTPLFKTSTPPGALTCPATWPALVQLAATFGPYWRPSEDLLAWIDVQTARRLGAKPAQLRYQPPAGLVPRDYQVAGALEIARTGRALIFDEPRTGKTMTTILGILEHSTSPLPIENPSDGPVLVVCPASVVDPWVQAWRDWAPHLTTVAWRGSDRKALSGTADVYVTSYDTARIDTPSLDKRRKGSHPLLALGAAYLVVDECHMIKNHKAARTESIGRLVKDTVGFVALSGTPITHHPADLYPALDCLAPGAFPSRDRWVKRYCTTVPTEGEYEDEILGLDPFREPEFRLSIVGQHRRVARADVMSQLPPKVYSVRTVEMPAEWRKAYDEFEAQMLAELPNGDELQVMDVQTKYNHLTRLASAPCDVEITLGPDVNEQTGELKKHVHLHLKAGSWKVDALLEILAERCGENGGENGGDRVVVFAPSKQLIKLAGAAAEEAGYRVGYVIGGQAMGERTEYIRAFQAGELDVICATTGAGGAGITLDQAGTVVFLQRPWALVDSIQAEDRGEGDMNAVRGTEVIDIVARNTIDTRVRAVLRERAGQLADLVQDPRIVAELLGGAKAKSEEAA